MIDIPFLYYLNINEVPENYISLNLYEVAATRYGPVISSSNIILFYYSEEKIWYIENIFESNTISGSSVDEEDVIFENSTVEISKSVFENLRTKFYDIIGEGLCVNKEYYSDEDYDKVSGLICNLKNYIKRIGIIK